MVAFRAVACVASPPEWGRIFGKEKWRCPSAFKSSSTACTDTSTEWPKPSRRGAREVQAADVKLQQVPELLPGDVIEKMGAKQAK
jgi:hypothetical protein